MNDKNNVIKISNHREMKLLMNTKSYMQFVHESPHSNINHARIIESQKKEVIRLLDKSFGIFLGEFAIQYGRVGLCAMALLEQEGVVFRVPATDFYIKTILGQEIIGNFRCLPETISSSGYAILPGIEADLIYKYIFEEKNTDLAAEFKLTALPCELGTSQFDLSQEIDDSEISTEGAILRHIEKHSLISRENICRNVKKTEFIEALVKLEADFKIIRLVGTSYYIRLIPQKYHPSNPEVKVLSFDVSNKSFQEILKVESRAFVEIACILMKSLPSTRDNISQAVSLAMRKRQSQN